MEYKELFKEYGVKNVELRSIVQLSHRIGLTIAQEPSAGMTIGLDEHALARQLAAVNAVQARLDAVHAKPIPDAPATHPTRLVADLTEQYKQFTQDGNAINFDTQQLSTHWIEFAVELAKSSSAGLAGSLTDADYQRSTNNLAAMKQVIEQLNATPALDLPETTYPDAPLQVPAEGGGDSGGGSAGSTNLMSGSHL